MRDLTWSASEKKIARRAFDKALERALAKAIADFKARAAAVTTPEEMWTIGKGLSRQRQQINEISDYRYSQLPLVFALLVREGYLDGEELSGLSDEKIEYVRRLL